MGANVEFDLFLKKEFFSFQPIISLLENEGLSVHSEKMSIFDDWQYTNEMNVNIHSFDLATSTLFREKFTRIELSINNRWRAILLTSIEEENVINLSVGISVEELLILYNRSDDPIAHFYDQLTMHIDMYLREEYLRKQFMVASMGVEYSVEWYSSILDMLQDDNGVERWILPKSVAKDLAVHKFKQEEKENTIVFSTYTHYYVL